MASTIPDYIAGFDGEARLRLEAVYEVIRAAVPEETIESIKWKMPTFQVGKEPLFFFTGAKRHLSFYPSNEAIAHFSSELSGYETTEHAIRFPHGKPLPLDLIQDLVEWRVARLGAGTTP